MAARWRSNPQRHPPAPRQSIHARSPAIFPAASRATTSGRTGRRGYVEYVDCLKKFINEQQALAEPHVKASNDAINEFNDGVKEYNAQIEKAKGN